MNSSNIFKNSVDYQLIYSYLINENWSYKDSYNFNCSIKTKYFVDLIIDNYYYRKKVNYIDEYYMKKSQKWNGSKSNNRNTSWIKHLFKLNNSSINLIKKISNEFSENEFRKFLIIYMTEIIQKNNFNKGSKVLIDWAKYLKNLNFENESNSLTIKNNNDINSYESISQEDRKELLNIQNNKDIDNQTKQYLYEARVGQGKYRKDLLTLHNSTCMISYIKAPELLIASHIVPWVESNNRARLDENNGLLLSASIDKLFDQHYISFDDDGFMVVSDKFKQTHSDYKNIMSTIGIYKSFIEQKKHLKLSSKTKEYMKRHFKELNK